jgi:hypothetical protein
MPRFTISGQEVSLDHDSVTESVRGLLPDPLQEHYVVVDGRRFPPKQVIFHVTGVDKADFTTHQARRVLKRLGFTAARVGAETHPEPVADSADSGGRGPYGGRQAAALEPFVGKWVALADPTHVLVAADTPQEVLAWLATHDRRAVYGMFRVPQSSTDAQGAAPL